MPFAADIYYHLYESEADPEKPPIVLIHGAGGSHLYWPSQIRRLPENRVYALDLPGHGKSGGRGHQTIPAYAEAVLNWMQDIHLHKAIVVGHSMGGAIAITMALNHPEHVQGLGLVGTGARLRVSPVLIDSSANPTTFQTVIDTVVSWSFSPDTPPRLTELAAQRMQEVRPSVMHGDFLACDAFDETERIDQIQQPTLVITGSEDQLTPVRFAQFLADKIPQSELEIIPGAGHMVMLEKPEEVAATLLRFIQNTTFI